MIDDADNRQLETDFADATQRLQSRIAAFWKARKEQFEFKIRSALCIEAGHSHPILDSIDGAFDFLRHSDSSHRFAAVLALTFYWPPDHQKAQPAILNLLRTETDLKVRRLAVLSLGDAFAETGNADALDVLEEICAKAYDDPILKESVKASQKRIQTVEEPVRFESLSESIIYWENLRKDMEIKKAEIVELLADDESE